MNTPLPFALAVILLTMVQESLATRSSCPQTRESLFQRSQHHALTGHSFLNQSGTARFQCGKLCLRHRLCLSFNHDDKRGMCQLNDARKEEFPESYKQDKGFSYFNRLVSGGYGSEETTTESEQQSGCVTETSEAPTQDNQDLGWQMVFKGVAGTGIKLYGLWTNTNWDSGSEEHGNYRNEQLYNAWIIGVLNIKQVKLSLYDKTGDKVELVFNGTDSDILSWFAKELLVSSPWSDLTTTATTYHFKIAGSVRSGYHERRFFITHSHSGCHLDRGWLVVDDTEGDCSWERSYSSYPVILYSTHNAVIFQNARNDGTLGMADYLTIHIEIE